MAEENGNGSSGRVVDLPELGSVPRGESGRILLELLKLPAGKALAVPKLTASQNVTLRGVVTYRNLGKLHTRTIGDETYVWIAKE